MHRLPVLDDLDGGGGRNAQDQNQGSDKADNDADADSLANSETHGKDKEGAKSEEDEADEGDVEGDAMLGSQSMRWRLRMAFVQLARLLLRPTQPKDCASLHKEVFVLWWLDWLGCLPKLLTLVLLFVCAVSGWGWRCANYQDP